MRMSFATSVMGFFLLVSCAPKQEAQIISPADYSGIIHGDTVADDSPIAFSTVQLFETKKDDFNAVQTADFFCTGTVISESVILTAAHCLSHTIAKEVMVHFSSKVELGDKSGWLKRVSNPFLSRWGINGVVHPGWRVNAFNKEAQGRNLSDIALLRFSGGLPRGVIPAKLIDSKAVLFSGQKIIGAGFGIYRMTPFEIERAPQLTAGNFEILDPNFTEGEMTYGDPKEKQFTCYGDSGGPLYTQDEAGNFFLTAIVSRGKDKTEKEGQNCTSEVVEVSTKVAPYLKWIASESKKLKKDPNYGLERGFIK